MSLAAPQTDAKTAHDSRSHALLIDQGAAAQEQKKVHRSLSRSPCLHVTARTKSNSDSGNPTRTIGDAQLPFSFFPLLRILLEKIDVGLTVPQKRQGLLSGLPGRGRASEVKSRIAVPHEYELYCCWTDNVHAEETLQARMQHGH